MTGIVLNLLKQVTGTESYKALFKVKENIFSFQLGAMSTRAHSRTRVGWGGTNLGPTNYFNLLRLRSRGGQAGAAQG